MFSQQQIEQAIATQLRSQDINAIQQANQIIMQWSQSSRSIKEAIDIITTSQDESIILSVCRTAHNNILHNWMNYSEPDRIAIRNSLATRLVEFNGSEATRSIIIELIVAVALKDWPEKWPSCVQDFINSAASSPEMCILDMKILSELIVTIHETEDITNSRRRQLIAEFDKSSTEIMQMIEWSLTNVGFDNICVPVSRLLKELCLTAPYSTLEPYMPNMYPALFNSFAMNSDCYQDTMEAISNLVINRADAKDIATKLFNETLSILGNFCLDEDSPNYIQIPNYILIFAMNFLSVYGPEIDSICFEGEDIIEDIAQLVQRIYTTIIKNPPITEHCEEYWTLWSSVLYRYSRTSNSKNPFEILQPCYQLFKPLIPSIRQSLFLGFSSAAEDGKLHSVNCQACWIFITSADKSGMIDFLEEQKNNPSPSLCYAIGLVDACLTGKEERQMIVKIFPALFEFNQKTPNVDFGISLLYAVSHSIRFMNRESIFFIAFGRCLMEFLRSPNLKIQSAAVNALFYISMRQPKLLIRVVKTQPQNENGNENQYNDQSFETEGEGSIIYAVYDFLDILSSWELKNATKLIKSIALVASSQENAALRQKIYQNITNTLMSYIASGQGGIIDDSLSIINSLTNLKLQDGSMIFVPLFNELVNLLFLSTQNQSEVSPSEIIETITSSLLVDINPAVMQNVQNFSGILLKLVDFRESALLSFALLRKKYDIMEKIFDQIYEALVKDVIINLATTQVEAFPILRFIRTYDIRKNLISLLLEVVVYFIKDERLEVSKESLKVLCKIIEFLCDEQNTQQDQNQEGEKVDLRMIVDARFHLISSTFQALTDTFHKQIFKNIAKAIQAIYRAMSVASLIITPEQFDNDFYTVISKIIPTYATNNFAAFGATNNDNKSFIINFSRSLRGHSNDFVSFSSDLKEFLVATNYASPSDKNLFRNELKLDSLEEELMNLVSGEEKNAILAEELEILPALRDFKI